MTSDWNDWVGRTEHAEDIVTPALLARYAATLGGKPDAIPLALHWCLCTPTTNTADLGIDGHPPKGGFLPPIPFPRRMWAGSELTFHAPLEVRETIQRSSRICSITPKRGSTGALVFVKIEHRIFMGERECFRDLQTIVYREAPTAPMAKPKAAGFRPEGQKFLKTVSPNEPLLFRYSALTFNSHRIHYDADYARSEEGYPALVVHGPLTASLMLDFASETLGRENIAGFTFQASAPAFVGHEMHLAIDEPAQAADSRQSSWSVFGDDGRLVMSGLIALR